MTFADALVDYLITEYKVTDVFGVPGGIILRFLEALDKRKELLNSHLMYHEQTAGFAACGYAQAAGKLGVAYATKGPGIMNMVTCIAEAYQESIPVLFITGHGKKNMGRPRFEYNQEIDIVSCVSGFVKYSACIDTEDSFAEIVSEACKTAVEGRPGPVLLDVRGALWHNEFNGQFHFFRESQAEQKEIKIKKEAVEETIKLFEKSERPVILIGDGIRQAGAQTILNKCFGEYEVPVLSSRGAQAIYRNHNYYGYIGSHGTRYSNFILSKADAIFVIGNRLAFPVKSESYRPIIENKIVVRIDIDEKEFERDLPGIINYHTDANVYLQHLAASGYKCKKPEWIAVCRQIKETLQNSDITEPVRFLQKVFCEIESGTIVCDVGNNEFWSARAYELVKPKADILFSKSFGTLGSAIGKAVGVYYATGKRVLLVSGDQGGQYNIQEFHYIQQWKLPITIVILNNECSGMIKDHEADLLKDRFIHVDAENGYNTLDFEKVAKAYGIPCIKNEQLKEYRANTPYVINFVYTAEEKLIPYLRKGASCEDMSPCIDRGLFEYLCKL